MLDLLLRISTLYNIPQWAVNVGAIAIFMVLVAFPFVVRKLLEPKYYKFKELVLYNVVWRWKYKKDDVVGLWCYCPKCGESLVCDDENCKATEDLQNKITFFVCNACGGHEQGRITGGDRRYALSLVKREVLRNVRTGDYVNVTKTNREKLEELRGEREALEALSLLLCAQLSEAEVSKDDAKSVENNEQEVNKTEEAVEEQVEEVLQEVPTEEENVEDVVATTDSVTEEATVEAQELADEKIEETEVENKEPHGV